MLPDLHGRGFRQEQRSFLRGFESDQRDKVDAFLAELPEIRASGLAFSRAGSLTDVHAVAAAIRDRAGEVVAALTVAGPSATTAHRLEAIGAVLLECVSAWRNR